MTLDARIEETLLLLQRAVAEFQPLALASSLGAEDMVLTDLIFRNQLPVTVFTLDTGRLPEPTQRLMARVREHYGQPIRIYFPEAADVEQFVAQHGVNGFYEGIAQRRACCGIRKVAPLRRALAGQKAWITGLRRDQSPTRTALAVQAWDEEHGLTKFSPLADWSQEEVWSYLRAHHVPYNALHDQGYASIGCSPCTRAIQAGEDERAGRWWWEHPETKECGLHLSAVS
ncbi:MAG: phosphoadenylyl-sulfate reductase [Betaproteobacteria bacterium]|nr:phosphoadenylyl-sulfate reductase [Betaproteobacteria bacterium]MDE2212061.1 phosphoadenylyl-sulfate reductase [Betaproteobacteria bacterium]